MLLISLKLDKCNMAPTLLCKTAQCADTVCKCSAVVFSWDWWRCKHTPIWLKPWSIFASVQIECVNAAVSVWRGVAAGSWCVAAALEATTALLPSLLSFITPSYLISQQLPPVFLLPPSLHFCHRCPLSNLITQALYPPHPPVCRSLLPSCLYPWPWLADGARHQGQISPSFLPFLPLPFFFFSLHWLYISCALSLLSNFCLRV